MHAFDAKLSYYSLGVRCYAVVAEGLMHAFGAKLLPLVA
jgi:hypothetical protein